MAAMFTSCFLFSPMWVFFFYYITLLHCKTIPNILYFYFSVIAVCQFDSDILLIMPIHVFFFFFPSSEAAPVILTYISVCQSVVSNACTVLH